METAESVAKEREYWYEIAAMLGPHWRVYGWNYRHDATLRSPSGRHYDIGGELATRLHEISEGISECNRIADELLERK